MAFNDESVMGILSREDISNEEKAKLLLSDHESDVNGLKLNKEDILGQLKKEKEINSAYKVAEEDYKKKIDELTEEVKKKSSDDSRQFYETQLAEKQAEFDKKYAELEARANELQKRDSDRMLKEAIENATANIRFTSEVMKRAFISVCMGSNEFRQCDIDGKTIFLNQDSKTVEQVFGEFALTSAGKEFISSGNQGGGAGGNHGGMGGQMDNPWKRTGGNSLSERMRIAKEDPELAKRLMEEAKKN